MSLRVVNKRRIYCSKSTEYLIKYVDVGSMKIDTMIIIG